MPTIVSDPTSPDFNCYVSLADAEVFIINALYASNWALADGTRKEKALLTATSMLDRHVRWFGMVAVATQNLEWPRLYVNINGRPAGTYFPSDSVPDIIQLAVTEYAEVLLGENLVSDDDKAGLSSIGVGPIALGFNRSDRKEPVPSVVRKLVEPYGIVSTGSSRMVGLTRT